MGELRSSCMKVRRRTADECHFAASSTQGHLQESVLEGSIVRGERRAISDVLQFDRQSREAAHSHVSFQTVAIVSRALSLHDGP